MISIIIPTLNEESVIGTTLKSLKAGLTIPHEIIVSDGASKDRTVEIARQYADKVVVYSGTARQTIAMGRNDGAQAARGDFLVFLDADCTIMNPDAFFTEALLKFEKRKEMVAMTVRVKVLPQFETLSDKVLFGMVCFNIRLLNNTLRHGESMGEFQMMRRKSFTMVKGFRGDLVTREDADMFLRLSKIGRTYADKKLIVYHTGRRVHKIGWPRLLSIWTWNTIYVSVFNRAASKEWEPIR